MKGILLFILATPLLYSSPSYAQKKWDSSTAEEARFLKYLPTEQYCQYLVMKQLGWNDGTPNRKCNELNLIFPIPTFENQASVDSFVSSNVLAKSLRDNASFCAYKEHVTQATNKLMDVYLYKLKLEKLGFVQANDTGLHCKLPSEFWEKLSSDIEVYSAITSPAKAMKCIYEGKEKCGFECAVGRQLFELGILWKLFSEDFNAVLETPSICVGDPDQIARSQQFYYGTKRLKTDSGDDRLNIGKGALVGVSGYIGNALGEDYLDSQANRGENFVVVSDSSEAILEIEENGPEYFDRVNQEVWEKFTTIREHCTKNKIPTCLAALKNKECFLETAPDSKKDCQAIPSEFSDELSEIRKELQSPFYKDVSVVVHPIRTPMSFGEHIVRQFSINPRTPYKIEFSNDQINTAVFGKYKRYYLEDCKARSKHRKESFQEPKQNRSLLRKAFDKLRRKP